MTKEFVTGIWLARFDNKDELREYVSFDYENEDDVTSRFATDIGLSYFDQDFMESVFFDSPSAMHDYIGRKDFVNNKELSSKFASIEIGDQNSVISILGIKGDGLVRGGGLVNEELFHYKPIPIDNGYLTFVGLFRSQQST
jgi:hypothetical protein